MSSKLRFDSLEGYPRSVSNRLVRRVVKQSFANARSQAAAWERVETGTRTLSESSQAFDVVAQLGSADLFECLPDDGDVVVERTVR